MSEAVTPDAYINFAYDPKTGGVFTNFVYVGGFDRSNRCHLFVNNVRRLIEQESTSQCFEELNYDDVHPTTAPKAVIHET